MSEKEDKKAVKWSVAEARRRFSDVVRMAAEEPQAIYNRDRIVGAVVDPSELAEFEEWKRRREDGSVGDTFQTLREMCQDSPNPLVTPRRSDRPNPFADDDVPR